MDRTEAIELVGLLTLVVAAISIMFWHLNKMAKEGKFDKKD